MNPIALILGIPLVAGIVLALIPGRRFRLAARINIVASAATLVACLSLLSARPALSLFFFIDDFNVYLVVLTAFVGFTSVLQYYAATAMVRGCQCKMMMRRDNPLVSNKTGNTGIKLFRTHLSNWNDNVRRHIQSFRRRQNRLCARRFVETVTLAFIGAEKGIKPLHPDLVIHLLDARGVIIGQGDFFSKIAFY